MTGSELKEYLENPRNFGENRVPAHSDHFYYEHEKETVLGEDMPLRQSLNGVWKFKYSKNLDERPEDFYEERYDLKDFDDIKVPGHIELQGYDTIHYSNIEYPWDGKEELFPPQISKDDAPVGSYATDFRVSRNLEGKPLFISFQGVETAFRLFINGKYVGYGEDTFTPTEFEITDFVHSGRNRIAVECYKRSSASWLEDQDMFRFFGIFRDVYLYAIPKAHVKDMFVKALLNASYDKGILDVSASLYGNPATVQVELDEKEAGRKVFEASAEISGENAKLHIEGLNIRPWSAEEPNLYTVKLILKDEKGQIIEIAVTNAGFRTFEMKDRLMLLNGKRIIFKGVNRHDFSAVNGRHTSKEEMLEDILTFKRNNINAVRTCHYPNQSYWYRLCDEYGIYMIDETNMETHGTWGIEYPDREKHVIPWSKPEWTDCVIDRANSMFMRDKNHPAVLLWSLGNESFGGDNFIKMHDFLHEKDDTRLVHYEGCINYPPSAASTDVHSQMYAKPAEIDAYLSGNPDKPYISCEYMHAMGNSVGGMKLYTDLEDKYDMYQGGFIWDFIDQAIWQEHNGKMRLGYGGDFGDRPTQYCFSTDGLMFADRTESPKMAEAKELYANVKLTATDKEITIENRNLFINLNRYSFLFKVLENGKEIYKKEFADINVNPGEKISINTEFTGELTDTADYVFRVEMLEKYDTKWAKAGYMVAFGESVRLADTNPILTGMEKVNFKHVADGISNFGAVSDECAYMFEKNGKRSRTGLVSLKSKGKEIVTLPPMPTFFRAYTDNDKGFGLDKKACIWHTLSRYQIGKLTEYKDMGEYILARYDYRHPDDETLHSEILYKAYPEGRMEVTIKYFGKEGLPTLPLYGFEMKVSKEYDMVEYFGKGPGENYRDRDNGVYTDVFNETVGDNLTPYLIPQEVGNRTGVRYAKFTNAEGHGLMFATVKGTFELGFLPYSSFELDNAEHLDELPERNYTWIRIMEGQMGVGGDDSWSAPVHDEFLLDSSKDRELTFEIRLF